MERGAEATAPKREKTARFRETIFSPLALGHGVGEVLYYIGFETEYTLLRFARACKRAVLWVFYGVLLVVRTLGSFAAGFLRAVGEDLAAPWRQLRQGLHNLRTMLRAERAEGGPVAGKGVAYVVRGVRAYRDLVYNALSYLLPIAALLVLVVTVYTVLSSNFALAVQYRGEFVGYIANETVFEEAQDLVRDRIRGEDTGEDWAVEPEFTIAIVNPAAMRSRSELADAIISTSSGHITNATGVVVDGTLVGATQDSAAINQLLNEQKAPYETGQENLTVRFAHEVELVPGVYFTETLISEEELAARLLGQVAWTLASGEQVQQNYLTVQQVFRETYEETVPYPTQEVENSDLAWGKRVPLQEGIDGTKLVTADVVYQDGQEQGRTIVSEETLVEAVPEIIQVGSLGGAPGSGQLMFPVPDYVSISRGRSYYHRGLDIAAPQGTPIYAADNGIVTFSGRGTGYNWSYGNYVRIDHGNGLETLYAHCYSLVVSEGEYVTQGQLIAYVGNTGRSFGNHCHFEVIRDGNSSNPEDPDDYVTRPHG